MSLFGELGTRKELENKAREEGRLPPGQSLALKWPVLHYGSIPLFHPETWDFKISGEVEKPARKRRRRMVMPKKSAGLLLYRNPPGLEVFLVHPGGPFWAKKDDGAWSIPKGEFADIEDGLEAAKREFREETGFQIDGDFEQLQPVKQAAGKVVVAWCVEGQVDASAIRSNTFSMEWPPRSGKSREFPEVDRAGWFDFAEARRKILKGQVPLLEQLQRKIRRQ